jgi:CheY-like chemotaxis protein
MGSNILIVENNDGFRKTLSDHLTIEGYKVLETQVIAEARGNLSNHKFNAAIVDVRMKNDDDKFDWSGLILAREIAGKNIPVVILSAYDRPADIERAYNVATGVKPPYAFISKNDPDYLEKVSEKLKEIAIHPKGAGQWLKQNWESLVEVVLSVVKKFLHI